MNSIFPLTGLGVVLSVLGLGLMIGLALPVVAQTVPQDDAQNIINPGSSCFGSESQSAPLAAKLDSIGPAGTLHFSGLTKPVRLAGVTGIVANGVDAVLRLGRSYLVYSVGQEDRYGRQPAHLVGDGTRWVQGDLLAQGHALFQSDHALSAVCLAALRRAEKLGESARRGVWADATLTVGAEDIAALRDKRGQYVLVKGKVLSVGDRKRRVYLNFGQKWNQDFTVSLAKSGRRAFKGDLVRVLASKGKTLRVRGVLEWSGGPLIRVLDEGQIELALP